MNKFFKYLFYFCCFIFLFLLTSCLGDKPSSSLGGSKKNIYTITYNHDATTLVGTPTSEFLDYSSVVLPSAVKYGYIFDGWYEGDTKVEKITENRDYNLTAKFNIINYPISYELNGGYLPGLYNSVDDLIYEIVDSAVATTETLDTIEDKYLIIRNNTAQYYGNDDRLMSFYFNSKEKYNFLIEYFKDNSKNKSNINWDNLENANDFEEFFELDGDNIAYFCSELYNFVLSKWSRYSEFPDGFPYCFYVPNEDYNYKEVKGSYYDENLLNKLYDYMPKTTYKITSDDIDLTNKLYQPIKEGYAFSNWYKESQLLNPIFSIPSGSHSNIVLYASWTKLTKYTFEPNGGELDYCVYEGVNSSVFDLPIPTKDGYTFVGWFDENENPLSLYSDNEFQLGSEDKIYYANWLDFDLDEYSHNDIVSINGSDTYYFKMNPNLDYSEGVIICNTPDMSIEFVINDISMAYEITITNGGSINPNIIAKTYDYWIWSFCLENNEFNFDMYVNADDGIILYKNNDE